MSRIEEDRNRGGIKKDIGASSKVSWEDLESDIGVECANNKERWADALVIKLPGTLKIMVSNLRRRFGVESNAMAMGLCIAWTDLGLSVAENGGSLIILNSNGEEERVITSDELRERFRIPKKEVVRTRWRDFLNPNPQHQ